MEKLPWITEYEKLRAFKEEVKRLVKTDDNGLYLLPLEDLLSGLRSALGDKSVRYEKTYRDGCKCMEECGDERP